MGAWNNIFLTTKNIWCFVIILSYDYEVFLFYKKKLYAYILLFSVFKHVLFIKCFSNYFNIFVYLCQINISIIFIIKYLYFDMSNR